jgi:hypothetical protein
MAGIFKAGLGAKTQLPAYFGLKRLKTLSALLTPSPTTDDRQDSATGEKPPEPPSIAGKLRRKCCPDEKARASNRRLLNGAKGRQKGQPKMTGSLASQNPASSARRSEPHAGLTAKLRRQAGNCPFCRFSLCHGVLLCPASDGRPRRCGYLPLYIAALMPNLALGCANNNNQCNSATYALK